jgi:3'(2'),5'-bisphosphate nucleotidase
MKVTTSDLDGLREIAQAAAQAVMQVYASDCQSWLKTDASPQTDADLRADAIICAGLARAYPGVPVLSEESGSSGRAVREPGDVFFLVDPLDGTKEFLKRNGEFTVNIALVAGGVPIAGVVVAPALGESYFAAQGLGAWKSTAGEVAALQVRRYEAGATLRIVGSRSHGTDRLSAALAKLAVPHEFTAVGSSVKFCRVAEGQADLYARLGPTRAWDTAAAQCVLEVAGGCVFDLAGQPLRYGIDPRGLNPEFLAVADRAVFDLIAAWLAKQD